MKMSDSVSFSFSVCTLGWVHYWYEHSSPLSQSHMWKFLVIVNESPSDRAVIYWPAVLTKGVYAYLSQNVLLFLLFFLSNDLDWNLHRLVAGLMDSANIHHLRVPLTVWFGGQRLISTLINCLKMSCHHPTGSLVCVCELLTPHPRCREPRSCRDFVCLDPCPSELIWWWRLLEY